MLGVVTLLYSLDYLPGTLTLAYQLRKLLPENSNDKRLCLILSKHLIEEGQLSDALLEVLQDLFDEVIEVQPVDLTDPVVKQNQANLIMLENRSELAFTFLKLHLWELTQFEKVLYLDSDVLPLDTDIFRIFDHVLKQNSDQIAAVPDCGWPDLFNSGVMVIKPEKKKYDELHELALRELSIDGADQGILNQFFNPMCHDGERITEWIRLPFFYNVTSPGAGYQYTPAIKFFANKLRLVHFIGKNKPWKSELPGGAYNDKYRNQWWALYTELCQNYFKEETAAVDIDQLCRKIDNTAISETEACVLEQDQPAVRWDPATEPPSKDLPPEAPNLNISAKYDWEPESVAHEPTPEPEEHRNADTTPFEPAETDPKPLLPQQKPAYVRPKPIFPWESAANYIKPTRVFPDDD